LIIRQGFAPAIVAALERQLGEIGFGQVALRTDLEQALEALPQDQPEVILLHLSQQTAKERLRQASSAAYLILSTSDEEAQQTDIDPAGPSGFVRWPCPDWELRARIEAMVFRSQREQALIESDERFRQALERAGVTAAFPDITRRLRAEAEVNERLKFEMMINELSARFINLPAGEVDQTIEEGLERIAQALGLERCAIAQLSSDQKHLIYTHTYSSEDPPMARGTDIAEVAPWYFDQMLQQKPILVSRTDRDLPTEAALEHQIARSNSIKSVIALPIIVDGKVFGAFSAASRRAERTWPPELVSRLRLVGEIFASALARKRSEEALRQSEERYRQLFEINQAIKLVIDPESGHIIDANQAAAEFYGYSLEKLRTMRIQEINTLPEPELLANLHQAAWGGRRHFNVRHRLASGEVRDVEIYTGPVAMQDRRLLYSIVFDVTERLRAEAERERLLAQVREIMNSVPEGVALLDWSGRVLTANPVAEAYLETLASVKIGQQIARLGELQINDILATPEAKVWHEINLGERFFMVTARPVVGKTAPEHWVLVLRDATQEHHIQQQIQQQERLAAVGQMAAGIAHDFNNILSVILLYAEIALSAPDLPAPHREHMLTIKQQADRASNLIQQVLDFSRRAVLERRPMDLLPFVKEQAKLFERTLPEDIRVRLGYKPGEYKIKADPTRLQQALLNLAVNARDAMPQGGELYIALSAVGAEEKVHCITCGQVLYGNWISLTVSDTGVGIPADVLPHIFEPFFTTKPPGQGTGLGLAQVYGIVKQHEGHIDVQTRPGAGSTFRIFLPAYAAPNSHASISEADALALGNGQMILLVEDEAETRQALVEGLTLLNYRVKSVADGVAALSYLALNPGEVALVLSDVIMPKMGGVALLRAMRRANMQVPVVLISGHPLTSEVESLKQKERFWYLTKPASLRQLSHVLAEALKIRAS
jgi:PAS domain S-box-containing protein